MTTVIEERAIELAGNNIHKIRGLEEKISELTRKADLGYEGYKNPYEFDIIDAVEQFKGKIDSCSWKSNVLSKKDKKLLRTYIANPTEYEQLIDSAYMHYLGIGCMKNTKEAYYRFCLLAYLNPDIWREICSEVYTEISI